jgi:Tol biopolymer transport system component
MGYRPWSWSPDGRWIIAYSDVAGGMIVYSTATAAARRVSETGQKPRWLSDSRRVVYVDAGTLRLMDVESGRSRELYAVRGERLVDPAISRNDRTVYFSRHRDEADIWMGTLVATTAR